MLTLFALMACPFNNVNDSSPRILHICKVYLPEKGGVQRVVHNIAALLQGYQHTVLTTGKDGAVEYETTNNTAIHRCHSYGQVASMPIAPSLIWKTLKEIKKQQIVAVHYPFPLADLALLFSFNTPPIVVHWHSRIVVQKRLKWIVAPFSLLLMLKAKAIVITSERMIDSSFLLRAFKQKTHIIPYGLSPLEKNMSITNGNDDYFMIIGRHVSYKGIDVAIRALQESSVKLVIAGHGPLYEKHKKLASDLGVSEQINFKPHACDEAICTLLHNATALVVPSIMDNEAFALVQLEAMRLSKAIINTNLSTSVPWVARHQQEAITVPPRNAKALANAMNSLMTDKALAKRLGDNGFKRYQHQFTGQMFAQKLSEFYASLITDGTHETGYLQPK